MSLKLKKVRVTPQTEAEQTLVERYGEVWEEYPGIVVQKAGHLFLIPERSDHMKWWPLEQVIALTPAIG